MGRDAAGRAQCEQAGEAGGAGGADLDARRLEREGVGLGERVLVDDETYDWLAVVEGLRAGGGRPLTVSESLLGEANALATESTRIPVDPTGSAGLAGLLALRRDGDVGDDERVAVLFTGIDRRKEHHR